MTFDWEIKAIWQLELVDESPGVGKNGPELSGANVT